MIEEVRGEKLDLNSIPLDDEETYEMLRKGKTKGVFQLESDGMTELVKKLLPDRFEDLIALVALFRPGPLGCGMVDQYCDCKHGKAEPNYLHPCLKSILEDTYGVILYQEQVMRIASELSGFSLSEADRLRKAMGKKKLEIMKEYRSKFVEGAEVKHGVPREEAEKIFSLIEYFSGYGFNKSHSAAYGLVSYQTAYLKAHYPKEFMAALMTNESQDSDKIVKYIHECESMGIKVLPPNINESKGSFRPTKEGIRFGLAALKGVGEKAIAPLEEAREKLGKITSLFQLCKNVDTRLVNKQVLESLTKSGAFDCWNRPRRQIFDSIPEALKIANNIQKEKSSNQMVLFDFGDDEEEQEDTSLESYLDVPEWSDSEKLKFEKETIGFFMSSHPLQHLHYITQKIATPIKELDPMDKSPKIIACIIVQSHVTQIKQGKSQGHKMAQLVVEDKTGNCKVTCFASAYEANPELYQEDKIIFIQGKQDVKQNDEVRLIVDKAYSLEEGLKLHTSIVNFNLGTQFSTEEDLLKLKNILIKYHGNCPIALVLNINSQEIQLQPAPEYNIDLSPDFFKEIEQSFDDSVITLVKRELEQKNTPYRRHSEYNKK